jgi:alkylation response protein AidB-like acyl-CoA dehydrogenase
MDFNFTEEQSMVRDTVASFLQDKYDFETRRKIVSSDAGWRADYWKAFAEELGILGASFSEELGGLGGGAIDNMIIMEEFGKALVIEPYLGHGRDRRRLHEALGLCGRGLGDRGHRRRDHHHRLRLC